MITFKHNIWREIMKQVFLQAMLLLTLASVSTVYAGELNIPHNFSRGTPAIAAEVNENFSAIETEVDDNHGRISNIEATNTAQQSQIDELDTRVSALENSATNAPAAETIGTLEIVDPFAQHDVLELSLGVTNTSPDPTSDRMLSEPVMGRISLALQVSSGSDINNLIRDMVRST
jgi:hypothetical protein